MSPPIKFNHCPQFSPSRLGSWPDPIHPVHPKTSSIHCELYMSNKTIGPTSRSQHGPCLHEPLLSSLNTSHLRYIARPCSSLSFSIKTLIHIYNTSRLNYNISFFFFFTTFSLDATLYRNLFNLMCFMIFYHVFIAWLLREFGKALYK